MGPGRRKQQEGKHGDFQAASQLVRQHGNGSVPEPEQVAQETRPQSSRPSPANAGHSNALMHAKARGR